MKCRICNSGTSMLEEVVGCNCESGFEIREHPFFLKTTSIQLYRCLKCGHIQSAYKLEDGYYQRLENDNGFSTHKNDIFLDRCRQRLEVLCNGSRGGNFLEIGCGMGDFLKISKSYFDYSLGIEPSVNYCKKLSLENLNYINDEFHSGLSLKKKYKAVASLQVFEHLVDLYEVINYVYDVLIPGGCVLINVPNGGKIIREGLFHQIINEHINYYTISSLSYMANSAGFDILRVDTLDEWVELDIFLQKPCLSNTFGAVRRNFKRKLDQFCSGANVITIWGAGSKSGAYSELVGDLNISYVIDSDDEKIGKFISGIPLPIKKVSNKIIEDSDIVLIFSSAYNEEIISELKDRMKYKGKVVFFEGRNLKILNLNY